MEHRIVAVRFAVVPGCKQCSDTHPHNVIAICACGERSAGRTDHIWTVTERTPSGVTLQPSFNWLVDKDHPEKGAHLHQFVVDVALQVGEEGTV